MLCSFICQPKRAVAVDEDSDEEIAARLRFVKMSKLIGSHADPNEDKEEKKDKKLGK